MHQLSISRAWLSLLKQGDRCFRYTLQYQWQLLPDHLPRGLYLLVHPSSLLPLAVAPFPDIEEIAIVDDGKRGRL
jgi:hypothetical protein